MYIYIGHDCVLRGDGVIGIFDLDNVSQSVRTRSFLNAAEKSGKISTVGPDIPKSAILYDGRGKSEVLLAQMTAGTIAKKTRAYSPPPAGNMPGLV